MSRKSSRRKIGTDVTQLWDLPNPGPPPNRASTGPELSAEELDRKAQELRELLGEIRSVVIEGHGVLKDLRIESKRARRILPMIVTRRINLEVERQLTAFGEATQRAMADNVDKVGREFGKLERIFLGTDHESVREGRKSIPEIIKGIHAAAGESSNEG